MNMHRLLLRLTVLCVLTLFAVSCGDDSATGPGDNRPPVIELPPVSVAVDFNSEEPLAQTAQTVVRSWLTSARATTVSGTGLLHQLGEHSWSDVGACFSASGSSQGCTKTYRACETAEGFNWTVTWNGRCAGANFDDWVSLRGKTSIDGAMGTLRLYAVNSQDVEFSTNWTRTADDNSGTWDFYTGDLAPENHHVAMTWAETAAGAGHITWEVFDLSKWVLDYTQEGNAGTLLTYTWVSGWIPFQEITWTADGHGSWTEYDGNGGSTTQSW